MPEGYRALLEGAAWMDVSSRGAAVAAGRDRTRLLHNLTTNDIRSLRPGQGCYAFLLTPQGRIQADVNVLALEDSFLLDTEPETRERLPALIRKYIIADDVKLEDAGLAQIALEGPAAAGLLARLGAPAPEREHDHAAWDEARVARLSLTGREGFRIFAPVGRRQEITARLAEAGAVAADAEAFRLARIEAGLPRYGEDIFETTLPQESGQLRAIHFSKGCYLGQEIVERIRARGHVNRRLVRLEIETETPPARGARMLVEGQEAGEITSAAFSLEKGKVVALGYARVPHTAAGTRLEVDGRAGSILP